MSELIKRLITAMTLCLTALLVHAQEWTKEDSLRLRKLLDSDQELNLNQDAVRQIDFGSAVGTPRMSVEKKWMLPDESLPEALPKPKVVLSLMPYKANTPYNWDPVFQKKIRMDKNTKIYVAGHHGLVGSAIWNNLQGRGYTNLVGRSRGTFPSVERAGEWNDG